MNYINKNYSDSPTLFVLIHGLESSKQEWTEKDGYTKGGNLTEYLDSKQISWIAADLYGHGDFHAEEKHFDCSDISDELWEKFIAESVNTIIQLVQEQQKQNKYQSISLVSYSAGSIIAMSLLKKNKLNDIQNLFMASFCPETEADDEYSIHNNLELFRGLSVYGFSGSEDEEVPLSEAENVFFKLPSEEKEHYLYNAGHSLPALWINDFAKIVDKKISNYH